ncbi:MAG: PKD domain-containing protein [Bacteroidota bacterium]
MIGFSDAYATHFRGGSFRFETVGNCTTRAYVDLFFDCGGANFFLGLPNPGNITVEMDTLNCPITPTIIGQWTKIDSQNVTPICPAYLTDCVDPNATFTGVHMMTFAADYDFCQSHCPNQKAKFTFNSCCLNNSSLNIAQATSPNSPNLRLYFEAAISMDTSIFNQPPRLYHPGTQYLCISQGGTIDLSAYDPDGDSIAYQIAPCLRGPLDSLNYNMGFSYQDPFGPLWSGQLDSLSGLMTVNPLFGLPGSFQTCINIQEWRNGELLSSIDHVVQVVTVDCGLVTNNAPGFIGSQNFLNTQALTPSSFKVYAEVDMSVDLLFGDLDLSDSLTLSYDSTTLPVGMIVNTSGANPLTVNLSWMPDVIAIAQTFTFNLNVQTQDCPFPVMSTQQISIKVVSGGLSAVITDNICNDSIGAIDLTFLGTNPPYTYQWSNGATTEDIFNLPSGTYWVNITQPGGFFISDTFFVGDQDLIINTVVQAPTCDLSTGAIYTNVIGGVAPYTYQWSNGANSNSIWNQAAGGYNVIVSDNQGCINQKAILLAEPDSCFVEISGIVYQDLNANCVQDSMEVGIAYVLVDISPGWANMTDSLGRYSFQVDTGNYQLSLINSSTLSSSCPPSGIHGLAFTSYAEDTTGINFGADFISFQDIRTSLNTGIAVPGITRYQSVDIYNEGSLSASGTISARYDSLESWNNQAIPLPSQYDSLTRTLTWQYDTLIPGTALQFRFYTNVDTNAFLTDTLKSFSLVSPILGDSTPTNNADTLCIPVFAAYDPNDIQVSPAGVLAPLNEDSGYIDIEQQLMQYRIRFQNTGNFPATYVQILDTIDQNLDALQFRPAGSSHPYRLDIKEDSIFVFTFANISLPDSTSDLLGSQGFVSFLLPHRGTLSHGTRIYNRAAIYFDFNPPIFTNQVQNVVYDFPEISFVSDQLCQGEALTINLEGVGTTPFQLNWNGQIQTGSLADINLQLQIDSSSWQYISWVDALGFRAEDSMFISIAKNKPIANFSTQAFGQQVDFFNTSVEGFQATWDFGDGNTSKALNPIHIYDSSGTYEVKLIVRNGCGVDTLSRVINVFTTSLEEEFARSVKLAPNPFSQNAILYFSNPQAVRYKLRVYDANGRLLHSQHSRDEYFLINRLGLSKGLYFYTIQGDWKYQGKMMIH